MSLIRAKIGEGTGFDGPAIIEEHTATTIVGPRDALVVGRYGELVIEVRPGAALAQSSASEGAET